MSKSSALKKSARKPAPKAKAKPATPQPKPTQSAKVIPMVKKLTIEECNKQNIPLTDPRHPLHRPVGEKPAPAPVAAAKPIEMPKPKTDALSKLVPPKAPSTGAFKVGDKVRVLMENGKPSKEVFTIVPFEEGEPQPVPADQWFAVNKDYAVHVSDLVRA